MYLSYMHVWGPLCEVDAGEHFSGRDLAGIGDEAFSESSFGLAGEVS